MQVLRDEYSDLRTRSFEDYRRMVNAQALGLGVVIRGAVQEPLLLFEWLALPQQFEWVSLLRALWLGAGGCGERSIAACAWRTCEERRGSAAAVVVVIGGWCGWALAFAHLTA